MKYTRHDSVMRFSEEHLSRDANPLEPSSEQLNLLPNGSSSGPNSYYRKSNLDRLNGQQLNQVIKPLIQAIARLEQQQEEIQKQLASNTALLQELKQTSLDLQGAQDTPTDLPASDASGDSPESLLDMSQAIARSQDLASRQSLRPAELMNQFLESKLKQRERSPWLVLNGKELSWITAIAIVGAIWLSAMLASFLMLLGFASPLLERLTVLQQIDESPERKDRERPKIWD